MPKEDLTDSRINELLRVEKRILNPNARRKIDGRHWRADYRVSSLDGTQEFAAYTRQSTRLPTSFSAGCRWIAADGESIMLIRCNGPSHTHTNAIEGNLISLQCHVHAATERYLAAGKRDEGYAYVTDEYGELWGAFQHLLKLCNIAPISRGDSTDQIQLL